MNEHMNLERLPHICGTCRHFDEDYCGMWNRPTASTATCSKWETADEDTDTESDSQRCAPEP